MPFPTNTALTVTLLALSALAIKTAREPARIKLTQAPFGDLTKINATPRPQRTASDAPNQGQQQNDQRRPTNPFGPMTK